MREFILEHGTKHFDDSEKYWELLERVESINENDSKEIKEGLRKLMKSDPTYLEPYLLLADIYAQEDKMAQSDKTLDEAYEKALQLILDENGHWPDRMEWGWIENRPVIRALLRKADALWHEGSGIQESWNKAYSIYLNLLKTNPNDNPGVRYNLVAMLEGVSHNDFYMRFTKWEPMVGDVYSSELEPWFLEKLPNHPEMSWWKKYAESHDFL